VRRLELQHFIKQQRIKKNVSARELSEKIGSSNAYVSLIESGKIKNPKEDVIIRIFKELDINPEELIRFKVVEEKQQVQNVYIEETNRQKEMLKKDILDMLQIFDLEEMRGLWEITHSYRGLLSMVERGGKDFLKEINLFSEFYLDKKEKEKNSND
jgi:transcriptional regulator with XRE-family HTH domain